MHLRLDIYILDLGELHDIGIYESDFLTCMWLRWLGDALFWMQGLGNTKSHWVYCLFVCLFVCFCLLSVLMSSRFHIRLAFETQTKSSHTMRKTVSPELTERVNISLSITAMITCWVIPVMSCHYPGSCGSETCKLLWLCLLLNQIESFPVYLWR